MSAALAEHPRAAALSAAGAEHRWPYTPVRDWLASPQAAAEAEALALPLPAHYAPAPDAARGDWQVDAATAHVVRAEAQADWQERQWGWTVPANTQARVVLDTRVAAGAVLDLSLRAQIGAGARLHILRLVDVAAGGHGFETWQFEQAEDSRVDVLEYQVGAGRSHLALNSRLQGAQAEFHWQGLALLGGQARAVAQLRVEHLAPACRSRLELRNVLGGRSRRSVIGNMHVARAGQQTDSAQACHSLLLTPGARVDMRPELEIYADDVQCAHGATSGDLDETALHYLRSRGLDSNTARRLLLESFALPILGTADEGLQAPLRDDAGTRLAQMGADLSAASAARVSARGRGRDQARGRA